MPRRVVTRIQIVVVMLLLALLLRYRAYNFVCADNENCNEYVCGSVVSKCLLIQACQCTLKNCHCCRDCFSCLGDLYMECCSCLDMCPARTETISELAPKSQIGNFEGVPELFETLTAEEDDNQEWTVIRFPMRLPQMRRSETVKPASSSSNVMLPPSSTDSIDRQAAYHKQLTTINCTVIYLNTCITNKKCSLFCESMGASSYRWFHDGCCECVGKYCFHYGINESRCVACPDREPDGPDENDDFGGDGDDEESWDYGEEETDYN